MKSWYWHWLLVLGFVVVQATRPQSLFANEGEKPSYQRDIRPILAGKCFSCHGRDAEHREGGLRLDEDEAAELGGESGSAAIVPGEPEESELVRRIFSAEDSERMPPPDSKKALTDAEKSLLKQWIAAGAKYEAHWAFT